MLRLEADVFADPNPHLRAQQEFEEFRAVAAECVAADPSSQEWQARLAGAHGRLAAAAGNHR